jgi:hypothetical protein
MNNKLKEIKIILSGSKHGWNSVSITEENLYKLVKTSYSSAYSKFLEGYKIYRGERDFGYNNEKIIITKTFSRYSENDNTNIYTVLFSELLPSWSNYPKRNHSLICSSNLESASDYGDLFLILPKNDTKLGICPLSDIWVSFSKLEEFDTLAEFTNFIYNISKIMNINIKNKSGIIKFFNNFSFEVEKEKKNIEYYISNFISKSGGLRFYHKMIENKNNLFNYFDNLLNPEINHFELITIENYNLKEKQRKELWFDGQFIAISSNQIELLENI